MRAFLALCLLAVAGTASARLASIVQVGTSATPTATISPTRQGVELLPYNPSPNPKSTVSAGTARFTVLTDRLIHIQRAPKPAELGDTPAFDDRATLAVVNRFLPEPQFSSSVADGVLTITTPALKLQYVVASTEFTAATLNITSTDPASTFTSWAPGMTNSGNLLGTIKSLDEVGPISLNCTQVETVRVHDESLHCTWGLVSRDGWVVVNDTASPALDDTTGWWNVGMTTNQVDWYFFGHGHDYRGALTDYTKIGGKIAMFPRHANGVWWSRWYNYANQGIKYIVDSYKSRSIPLDTYVLDMDWHTKNHWGGYTVDPHLFPYPEDTWGDWLHTQGLYMCANLHDATGVYKSEATFDAMCTALGLNATNTSQIQFDVMSADYMLNLEDITLKAVEDVGMDFWWIDWQQGGTAGHASGGKENPTIWLNKVRATDNIRRNATDRGMVLARWGGLGNHRYQVGFSGDVATVNWTDLAYQPYFSMTATNVGFGFWSHDIVGPDATFDNSNATDRFDLYTRWIQWGAWSGVMRSHDRGMARGSCNSGDFPELFPGCALIENWHVPKMYFEANRAALQDRVRHIPYIYTATRQAFDSGLSLIRPMYYDFPSFDMAYAAAADGSFAQYMFGDDMMLAPVVVESDYETSLATTTIWIPPGTWYERDTARSVVGAADGSTTQTRAFDIREVPAYIKAGAVIPTIPIVEGDTIGVAQRQFTTLEFSIYPGATSGQGKVYEDDGQTTAYLEEQLAWTWANYTKSGTSTTVKIGTIGTFPELPASRTYTVRLVNAMPLTSASANGKALPYARWGGPNTWTYDGTTMEAVVQVDDVATATGVTIVAVEAATPAGANLDGMRGSMLHAVWAKAGMDETAITPGSNNLSPAYLNVLSSQGSAFGYLAGKAGLSDFNTAVANFTNLYNAAVTETKSILNQSQKRVRAANGLLASTMRPPSATHAVVEEAAPPQPFGMPFAPRVPHVTSARALRSGRQ